MSDQQPAPPAQGWKDPYRRPKRPFTWLKTLVLLLLFYLLTTGPLCRLADNKTIAWDFVHRLYAPLIWAAKLPPVNVCLEWYIRDVWKVKSNRFNAPDR